MKQNICDKCRQEIDPKDFYMIVRSGKVCSDCLMTASPREAGSAHLFRRRDPKWEYPRAENRKDAARTA